MPPIGHENVSWLERCKQRLKSIFKSVAKPMAKQGKQISEAPAFAARETDYVRTIEPLHNQIRCKLHVCVCAR